MPHDETSRQRPPCPGAPGAHGRDQARLPPVPCEDPGAFDHVLSAVIDHLMVIEDHQLAIEDHQMAIASTLTCVKTLVEEMLP